MRTSEANDMNEIIQRSVLAAAMALAILGGVGFGALRTAPGLPSMTPLAAPVLSDDVKAVPAQRLPASTPSPRAGYP